MGAKEKHTNCAKRLENNFETQILGRKIETCEWDGSQVLVKLV